MMPPELSNKIPFFHQDFIVFFLNKYGKLQSDLRVKNEQYFGGKWKLTSITTNIQSLLLPLPDSNGDQ